MGRKNPEVNAQPPAPDPPESASNLSRRILAEAHQLVAASRRRVRQQLLADGFTPRSLRTKPLPLPARAARHERLVAWARQVVWLADCAAQAQTTVDSLVDGASDVREGQA
jgi:streptogramin lyase